MLLINLVNRDRYRSGKRREIRDLGEPPSADGSSRFAPEARKRSSPIQVTILSRAAARATPSHRDGQTCESRCLRSGAAVMTTYPADGVAPNIVQPHGQNSRLRRTINVGNCGAIRPPKSPARPVQHCHLSRQITFGAVPWPSLAAGAVLGGHRLACAAQLLALARA